MSLDRIPYLPLTERPRVTWPGGAAVALLVMPNVMWWQYLPPTGQPMDPWPRMPHPDIRGYGHQDWGNRIGFWRMLDVLDAHGVRATAMANLAVLQRLPDVRDAMLARDWDFIAHGIHNTEHLWGFDEARERAFLATLQDGMTEQIGRPVRGFMGPGPQSATERTPDLLTEYGFDYLAGWYHDDQPMPVRTDTGRLVSIPYSNELSDVGIFGRGGDGADFERIFVRQLEHARAGNAGTVVSLNLHAYVMAQPHRIRHLDAMLAYAAGLDDVWITTADRVVDHWLAAGHFEAAWAASDRFVPEPVA